MESTYKKLKISDCNTFSKTFISIGKAIKATNEMSNTTITFDESPSDERKTHYKTFKDVGNCIYSQSDEKHPRKISRELPSSEVSVSLLISRNHNASISASCFFNSKQHQSLPTIRKFDKEKTSFPLKTSKLKIVEIPFEERELITKSSKKMINSPLSMPTSPSIFTWPKFKSSNRSDSTGIGSSLSVSSYNSSSGESDHFSTQNKLKDYRVISLDDKPSPGRLDDFVPEVERGINVLNETLRKENNIDENRKIGENKLQQMFYNIHSLNRTANSTNRKQNNKLLESKEKFKYKNENKKEMTPLERDEFGRLIIPSNEWRQFLAEQRPINDNRVNSKLQIIFRRDNYSNL